MHRPRYPLAVSREGPPRGPAARRRPPRPWSPWELLDADGGPLEAFRLFRQVLDEIRDRAPPGERFRVRRWRRREKFAELVVRWVVWIDPVDLGFRHREDDG